MVPDGHPDAAFLLGTAGYDIPDAEAARLGLKGMEPPANKGMQPPANKGGFVFEPEVKGGEGRSSGGTEPPSGDELPDDFPAVDILRREGYTTYAQVKAVAVLTTIPGIGKVYERHIQGALK